ncbi:hypothetical protein RFI_30556 [Reticulomyxa filosa]|uniref:Uncharacterized protein n=1 Tax=Reticulomyxa filosa TaxID=46433 RepID=X6LZR9_RETFI|nr:hypothetical protein RFI_30556 [Reticulomyxa filosa]|eukprot:ETO06836.1 hypothetical protein RFI_30556 [Reticulomyxa filosa]
MEMKTIDKQIKHMNEIIKLKSKLRNENALKATTKEARGNDNEDNDNNNNNNDDDDDDDEEEEELRQHENKIRSLSQEAWNVYLHGKTPKTMANPLWTRPPSHFALNQDPHDANDDKKKDKGWVYSMKFVVEMSIAGNNNDANATGNAAGTSNANANANANANDTLEQMRLEVQKQKLRVAIAGLLTIETDRVSSIEVERIHCGFGMVFNVLFTNLRYDFFFFIFFYLFNINK